MEHVHDMELMEHATGRLDAARRAAVSAHAASCRACRERLAELTATWDALGAWEAPVGERDIRARVLAAARSGRSSMSAAPMRLVWPSWTLRVAATVLVAVGAGHLAGRAATRRGEARDAPAVTRAEVEAPLRLGMFESDSPAGLASAFLGWGGAEEDGRQ